ncbi:hypothetical protein F4778DRAFT_764895, partial [Xylariomycetidae sp. FL2044]
MDSSPMKRRALAPLDANNRSPTKVSPSPQRLKSGLSVPTATVGAGFGSAKRRLGDDDAQIHEAEQVAKKTRVQCQSSSWVDADESSSSRQRSHSPADSCVFDNSAVDTSQSTVVTEPDAEADGLSLPTQQGPRRGLSREEAREKAEILRLRLGLASYKVRTGQADKPFAEVRRLPGQPAQGRLSRSFSSASASASGSSTSQVREQTEQRSGGILGRKALPSGPAGSSHGGTNNGLGPSRSRSQSSPQKAVAAGSFGRPRAAGGDELLAGSGSGLRVPGQWH